MIAFITTYLQPLVAGPLLEKYIVLTAVFLLVSLTYLVLSEKKGRPVSHRTKRLFNAIHVCMLCIFVASVLTLIIPTPHIISPSLPLFDPVEITPEQPLELVFDRPVAKTIRGTLAPHIAGRWELGSEPGRIPYNTLRFYPEKALPPDTEFSVEITNISPLTGFNYQGNNALLFVFKTKPPRATTAINAATMPSPVKQDDRASAIIPTAATPAPTDIIPTTTPTPTTFLLNVPLFKQHHTFTCYSVAAKMALAYRGVTIDELGFLNEIGRDNTERNFVTNTWGDPNKGVVGTHDGSGPGGYGTHWDPVANAMKKHRNIEVKRNWNIPEMLQKVGEGNPVMVWWVNGVWPAKDVSWNLPDGQKSYTVNGMHVEVVVGWVGDRNNPTNIITNDPWRGRRYYTPAQFTNLWKWFSNTGVIVY